MIEAAAIVAEAEAQVGIRDGDAIALHPNLERLVSALNDSGDLSDAGEASARFGLLSRTIERLEGLKWLRDFSEIADEKIEAPVFLCGLPRSGTTFFQNLFDRDDRFRMIRTWEGLSPNPPPGHDPASVATRIKEENAKRAASRPAVEGFEAVHLHDNGGPEECHAFMEQAYAAVGSHNLFDVGADFAWLADGVDWQTVYLLHRRQLQLLQWKLPTPRWALKYPGHCIAMEAIRAVHPDARFVLTHRDPVQVLASICKLTTMLRGSRSAAPPDKHRIGQQMLGFIRRHIDGIMVFADHPSVVHVDYYRLLDNPAAEMERVHAGLGIDSPDAVRAAVAEWHAANPKNARGRNDYALADYGLDAGAVGEAYSDYITRFAIPREVDGLHTTTPSP